MFVDEAAVQVTAGRGGDDTLFAKIDGAVVYQTVRGRKLASIDPGA